MGSQTKLHEEGLSTNQSHVVTGILVHSSELIDRVITTRSTSGLLEDESEVTPKFFRAINEEVGKRRLFVCCDGTWVNASGTTAPLTNVARFARAIDRFGLNPDYPACPVTQVIYYSAGIGSESVLKTRVDSIYSGITGAGLEEDILNAYCFLCNNYNFSAQNDEIILIGFSRGAFTVRCLADFISQVGLLQRKTLPFLSVLFQRWMGAKDDVDRERMREEVRKMNQTFSVQVKITVLAEWDTVSAIGHVGWRKKFSFMKDIVPENVQNAFLAIALNERRGNFKPMVYTRARRGTNVAQCVFCGCHSDIGGGNLDAGLSTVSLLWMAAKIQGACRASFDHGALLQMVQPPRPNAKWWYGRKVDETMAMNLLWSKGNINESLQGVWYIPHLLTLGWSSGSRRRHFRKTFNRQGHSDKHEQNEQQELDAQHNQQPIRPSAKLYKANYDYEKSDDVSKMVGEDVAGTIKEGIKRAGRPSPMEDTDLLTATVKTAIHVSDTNSTETRVTAVIDAAFKALQDKDQAATYQRNMTRVSNTLSEVVTQENDEKSDYIGCHPRIHFTAKELAKELGYGTKEGVLEGLSDKLGWLGHERHQLVDYLPQESYDDTEKKLWEEWKSQVDMWHASNEGRKGGWDKDVMYWSDVIAKFEKGGGPESLARKDMIQWELRTNQLCQVADAAAATAQAGLQMTVANMAEAADELASAARTVTRVAEMVNVLQGSEDVAMKKLWSTMDGVKGAFGRLPGEMLAASLARLLVGVAQTIAGGEARGSDAPPTAEEENVSVVRLGQAVSPQADTQTAIRMATGQLAGIAGVLAQTLCSPLAADASPAVPATAHAHATAGYHGNNDGAEKGDGDGDDDWRDKISQAKEAADRMVESANVLQNVSVPDTASWEAMKGYAMRAKEAAERAAKSIANATIQWKLTDEQRMEALCYRIAYPDWDSGEEERERNTPKMSS
ncbi:hypothetical protein F5B21DRAFT_502927 [Xylaria acuta]|nr:hypothetical protein F5B21DRAFT_502927 [Xylaria acuta]